MILVSDSKGRLASREMFPPATAFDVRKGTDGRITAIPLSPPRPPSPARSPRPLKAESYRDLNIDEPAFGAWSDEGVA